MYEITIIMTSALTSAHG